MEDSTSSSKQNACNPSRMEVNSGKSIHHAKPVVTLSNAACEQYAKTPTPNRREVSFGKSIPYSLHIPSTVQFQGSIAKVQTPFFEISHFDQLQRRHVLNHTHRVVGEREGSNRHSQSRTLCSTGRSHGQFATPSPPDSSSARRRASHSGSK